MKSKTIGIIGGMGPFAGVDINKKIFQNTKAKYDTDHINTICISINRGIPGRTEFLLGKDVKNPGRVVGEKISQFDLDIVGVACNSFHAKSIFKDFSKTIKAKKPTVKILNLPKEVKKETVKKFKGKKIGVLSTTGTYQSKLYQNVFKHTDIQLIFPKKKQRKAIQFAISDPVWGIKQDGILKAKAAKKIKKVLKYFKGVDVDAILLACTELPLILEDLNFKDLPFIDTNLILAKAFIRACNAELKNG